MFSGMLEVNLKSDQFDNYFGMAKMLRPELEKPELERIDGFVDNARFASLTRPDGTSRCQAGAMRNR